MPKQSGQEPYCLYYIAPEDRHLLARIARRRGIGHDYLALRMTRPSDYRHGRPLPRWIGRQPPTKPVTPAPPRPRTPPQTRRCHTCTYLLPLPPEGDGQRYVCGIAVWTHPMLEQSLHTSRRLRLLSAQCPHYHAKAQPARQAPHHCRACYHVAPAETVDERYICDRGVWTNPMKPQSIANARRLARLSSTCPFFTPTMGRWLPRSKKRAPGS